jgi:hypothetical protein
VPRHRSADRASPACRAESGPSGPTALLLTGIVIATAISTILDAALVATRAPPALAIKDLIGSIIKIVVLVALAKTGSLGLILAYGLGISLSSVLKGLPFGAGSTVAANGSARRACSRATCR